MISIIYRFKLDDQGLKCRNSYGTVREFPIHYLGLKTAKNKREHSNTTLKLSVPENSREESKGGEKRRAF